MQSPSSAPADRRGPIVVGIAGGVGSGKSAAARAIAHACGLVVIDFDRRVADALATPDVARLLADRWGPGVLDASTGGTDRKAVAAIVFTDDAERRWLESVLHPLVWMTRDQARDLAQAHGQGGVLFDAPLLFESGLDAECDAVVFVDCPREQRLARVRASRGWDEHELDRRERAQLPLEEKRRRSGHVIHNDGSLEELALRARCLCATLATTPGA